MVEKGVLGPIKAYFGTVENQGRSSLHLHISYMDWPRSDTIKIKRVSSERRVSQWPNQLLGRHYQTRSQQF